YRLSGDSPCASAPECGLIGALDVGCGDVAVNGSGVTSAMPKLVFAPNPVWSAGGAHLTGLDHGTVVDIYDLDGRGVATLGPITSDPFHWHPSRELPSGVYFARTRSIPATTARFVLVR
ncbi:MAG TPA: T9SS type A sorting domain-containing protein, partial [Candidatus Udaeobacter sp.]|nr:T9SS type A sorting domain-containing protein [Candidatus Udaeobacter sp.]